MREKGCKNGGRRKGGGVLGGGRRGGRGVREGIEDGVGEYS